VAGRYRLGPRIGTGASGEVFEAEDLQSGNRIAIKLLFPHVVKHASNHLRFDRQWKLLQGLEHPNILRLHEAGWCNSHETLFLAMDRLEGETFSEHLGPKATPIDTLMDWIVQALEGLAVAHEAGLVHRDLKPDNLFISDTPLQVQLIDFGLVRAVDGTGPTQTQMALGTPSYMAPEQATSASSVQQCADVWSMGVLLYRTLTGRIPFTGEGPYDVMMKVLTEPAPPMGPVPAPLQSLIEECLRKTPDERIPNARVLLNRLKSVLTIPEVRGYLRNAGPSRPIPAASLSAPLPAFEASTPGSGPDQGRADGVDPTWISNRAEPAAPSGAAAVGAFPAPSAGGLGPESGRPPAASPPVRRRTLVMTAVLGLLLGLGLWSTGVLDRAVRPDGSVDADGRAARPGAPEAQPPSSPRRSSEPDPGPSTPASGDTAAAAMTTEDGTRRVAGLPGSDSGSESEETAPPGDGRGEVGSSRSPAPDAQGRPTQRRRARRPREGRARAGAGAGPQKRAAADSRAATDSRGPAAATKAPDPRNLSNGANEASDRDTSPTDSEASESKTADASSSKTEAESTAPPDPSPTEDDPAPDDEAEAESSEESSPPSDRPKEESPRTPARSTDPPRTDESKGETDSDPVDPNDFITF
jgi:serine/threonine-protein kinase